jgi:hypothetical protein
MARTIVDQTGRMWTIEDSRQDQLEKLYDLMEEALRKDEKHFTKRFLAHTYGLRTTEVWGFIRLMERRHVLAMDKPIVHMKGQRVAYSETSWHIVNRPAGTPGHVPYGLQGFPGKTLSKGMRRRLAGSHLCDRCGSMIAGKGRHRKSTRGHTRDKCDLAMVRIIHET